MLAAFSVEEVSMIIVLAVWEIIDVFLDDLPSLPPVWEIEFGIDVLPGIATISKAPYRMALMELHELKIQLQKL